MSKLGTLLGATETEIDARAAIHKISKTAGQPPLPTVYFFVQEVRPDLWEWGITWADKDLDNQDVIKYISKVESLTSTIQQ